MLSNVCASNHIIISPRCCCMLMLWWYDLPSKHACKQACKQRLCQLIAEAVRSATFTSHYTLWHFDTFWMSEWKCPPLSLSVVQAWNHSFKWINHLNFLLYHEFLRMCMWQRMTLQSRALLIDMFGGRSLDRGELSDGANGRETNFTANYTEHTI